MPPRPLAWLQSAWLRAALTLGIFWALSHFVDLRQLGTLALRASPPLLGIGVLLFLLDQVLAVYKWQLLLEGLGVRVSFAALFRAATTGAFVAFFVPSALSADLYKGVVTARSLGSGTQIASSIVLERLLGVTSIVAVGLLTLGWIPRLVLGVDSTVALAVASTLLAGALAAFLHADVVFRAVEGWLPAGLGVVAARLEALANAFGAYRRQRGILVATFLLSIGIQICRCSGTWIIARALGDPTPYWAFLVFVPYLFMVNLLPFATSRIGLEQGAFVVLFGTVGMPPEIALAVSLLSVLTSLIVALPGAFWLLGGGPATAGSPRA